MSKAKEPQPPENEAVQGIHFSKGGLNVFGLWLCVLAGFVAAVFLQCVIIQEVCK